MLSAACAAVALAATVLIPSLPVAAQDAPHYEITVGTSGSVPLFTDVDPVAESAHGTRVYCVVSHLSYDDPVVHPQDPGAAHLHTFWGNTETDAYSTGERLLADGNASCEGGRNNLSAYWAPTMFDEDDQAVLPSNLFVYYKSFGINSSFDRDTIRPVPNGLQMLANGEVNGTGPWNFTISDYRAGSMVVRVSFPTCVAVDPTGSPVLSSENNTSHLSFGSIADGNSNHCPDSHPYRIPQIIYNMFYDIGFDSDWYLSSDVSAQTQGESLHADYIAAWDTETMNELVRCNIELLSECEFGDFAGHRDQLPERFVSPDGVTLFRDNTLLADADQTPFGSTLAKTLHSNAMTIGDVNCDNQSDATDAQMILQYVAGLRSDAGGCPLSDPATEIHEAMADFNRDGMSNAVDALLIAQCSAAAESGSC